VRDPSITPYRESVLAGQTRSPPRDAGRFRDVRRGGDYFAGRVPFHAERRAIESNGGRPIGRSELRSDRSTHKDRGDFFSGRQGTNRSDIKRGDGERSVGGASSFAGDNRRTTPRELNNDSVRDYQNRMDRNRERDRSGSSRSAPRARDNNREPVEIIRGTESRGSESRGETFRRDHMERPPANAFQPRDNNNRGGSNYYRPPRTETREPSRNSGSRSESRPWSQPRSEPRSEPRRSEPRRDYSPPARVQPRSEPRSQPQQPRASQPRASQPRSNDSGRSSGDRGRHSGSRPMNQPR
jgi:hypothetical protein